MKPEPYIPPLPRPLTEDETWLLRCASEGGAHAVNLRGAPMFAMGRRLEKIGLATVDGREFTPTVAGVAAVAHFKRR